MRIKRALSSDADGDGLTHIEARGSNIDGVNHQYGFPD